MKRIDCTVGGITKRCHAKCCYGPTYWPGNSGPNGLRCAHLGGQGCTLKPEDKPVTCHLYPFTLNDSDTLVLHARALVPNGCCFKNYKKGPPIIDAVYPSLVELFGQDQADKAVAKVKAGRDAKVMPPAKVVAALKREKQWAAENKVPELRSRLNS